MLTVVPCPGDVIVITPPQVQFNVQVLLRAGLFLIMTVAEPGVHGAAVTGTQGAGVGTPSAADVAAATAGFDCVEHVAKGMMFFIGILSMIVAAGMLPALTKFSGVTIMLDGADPNEHFNIAPIVTACAMGSSFLPWLLHFNSS